MLKVLQIARMNKGSGVASFLMNYYKNINRDKIQFIFISDYIKKDKNYKNEIENLGGKLYVIQKYTHIFSYIYSTYKIIRQEKPDIIHTHEYVISLIPLLIAKFCGVKIRIAHSHSSCISSKIKNLITKCTRLFFYLIATDFWACSEAAGIFLFGHYKDILIINNAVEYNKFKFNEKLREIYRTKFNINNKIVIGIVAGFHYEKNFPFCLEIFEEFHKQNPKSILLVCGDGKLRPEIENIIQSKNLTDCVILLGNVTNVNEILNCFDIFILTSHYEGLPVALVEAQANGLKCFAPSRVVPKICNINDKLVLIDKYDKHMWVDIINDNLQYKRSMSEKILVQYEYEIKTEAKKLEEKYRELLKLKDRYE